MPNTIIERDGAWQIATAQGKSGGFTAWAKMGPITGANPVNEPGEHVWFEFGKTRQEASDRLRRDIGLDLSRSATCITEI